MAKAKFLIVGNWKLNPKTKKEALSLAHGVAKIRSSRAVDVVIAPPAPYLGILKKNQKLAFGAQDVFWESEGAFTGQISAPMLREMGASYVIVGHSERRLFAGDTDEMIAKKIKHAVSNKLIPILCVGEQKRDQDGAFFGIIKSQVEVGLSWLKKGEISKVVIAYEPVWAIGSRKAARSEDANEAALFIKKTIAQRVGTKAARAMRVLYGGSVDGKNAEMFLKEREVGGLLVGGASKDVKEFSSIIACAQRL